MSEGLGDFFKLIAEDKKKKKEEFDELVGDISLDTFFSEVKNFSEENKKVSERRNKRNFLNPGCSLKQKKRKKRL